MAGQALLYGCKRMKSRGNGPRWLDMCALAEPHQMRVYSCHLFRCHIAIVSQNLLYRCTTTTAVFCFRMANDLPGCRCFFSGVISVAGEAINFIPFLFRCVHIVAAPHITLPPIRPTRIKTYWMALFALSLLCEPRSRRRQGESATPSKPVCVRLCVRAFVI